MDRKEALSQIGKHVVVDEQTQGKYIGILKDVIVEPRKPWKGLVEIVGIDQFPQQELSNIKDFFIREPIYANNEQVEIASSKISPALKTEYASYNETIINAVNELLDEYDQMIDTYNCAYEAFEEYLSKTIYKTAEEHKQIVDDYVRYTVKNVNNQPVLLDIHQGEHLPLEGCPFEFELKVKENWIKGNYISGWTFQSVKGKKYKLKEGQEMRLDKKHLDPYQLLINELEKPALNSLEKSLEVYDLAHGNVVHCHNSLLVQLLTSDNQEKFNGVNFITYQNTAITIIVQHHYERHLMENGNDKIYDRFELTTDKGKRSILTYTNEFSRDKK